MIQNGQNMLLKEQKLICKENLKDYTTSDATVHQTMGGCIVNIILKTVE